MYGLYRTLFPGFLLFRYPYSLLHFNIFQSYLCFIVSSRCMLKSLFSQASSVEVYMHGLITGYPSTCSMQHRVNMHGLTKPNSNSAILSIDYVLLLSGFVHAHKG